MHDQDVRTTAQKSQVTPERTHYSFLSYMDDWDSNGTPLSALEFIRENEEDPEDVGDLLFALENFHLVVLNRMKAAK